jgi:hypothetical protein
MNGRTTLLLTLSVVLAACGADVRETKITPELLESPKNLTKVMNRLEPVDRKDFSRYVAGRAFIVAGFGKPLVNHEGKDPATVAEALSLIRAADGRSRRGEAVRAEGDKMEALLEAKLEALRGPMEASRWAPGPTEAYNAVVKELNDLRASNSAREQAIYDARLP